MLKLQASGQAQTLVNLAIAGTPVTVFAPTDAAFATALATLRMGKDELRLNLNLLSLIVENHMVVNTALDVLVPNTAVTTLAALSIKVCIDLCVCVAGIRPLLAWMPAKPPHISHPAA